MIALLIFSALVALVACNYTNPVIHADLPDPGALIDPQSNLWIKASTSGDASNHFDIHSSPTAVDWNFEGYIFPSASTPSWGVSDFWAPEIHYIPWNNEYVSVFVARNKVNKLSVGLATSPSALGPFTDSGAELITAMDMGYIDPHIYIENGTSYILFKADANDPVNCNTTDCPTNIYIAELTSNYQVQNWTILISQKFPIHQSYEGNLVEAPWVIKRNNYYYLFYSANGYSSPAYAIGVARSTSLLGPFEKYVNNPVVSTGSGIPFYGPGHCSVIEYNNKYYYVYHAWNTDKTGRNVLLDELTFGADDWPVPINPSSTSRRVPS